MSGSYQGTGTFAFGKKSQSPRVTPYARRGANAGTFYGSI